VDGTVPTNSAKTHRGTCVGKKYNDLRKKQLSKTALIKIAIDNFAESLNKSFDIMCIEGIDYVEDKARSKIGTEGFQNFDVENEIQTFENDEADN
jgi:hypothetical protein